MRGVPPRAPRLSLFMRGVPPRAPRLSLFMRGVPPRAPRLRALASTRTGEKSGAIFAALGEIRWLARGCTA